MRGKGRFVCVLLLFSFCLLIPQVSYAWEIRHVNARSAVLFDMGAGKVLYEQNADALIAPASLTKILTLYLTFEAIERGQISLSDKVRVSRHAASMPNTRMGLKVGEIVTVAQLIHGIAIVSANDAAVAMAEHISGSVGKFVDKMNAKARELGMTSSHFVTPNGLPARGQLTTARDILKLSVAYIRRFPGALAIHSMTSYAWDGQTHHNPNNLLGRCPGVDGLKTGFVCASGFNISATAMRDHTRIIAVVMGAQSPGIRCVDAENLIEEGYRETGGPYYALSTYTRRASARGRAAYTATGHMGRRVRRTARMRKAVRHRLAARHRANLTASGRPAVRVRAVYAANDRRSRRVRRARVKKAVRHRAAVRGRARVKRFKLALRGRKETGNSAGTRKAALRHRKIHSRHISRKHSPSRVVSGKRSARKKSAVTSAKLAREHKHKAKSVRHNRIKVKTAVKKKGHESRHARALKKRANG